MRLHTVSRSTGKAQIWDLGHTFSSLYAANAYDTEGARRRHCTRALILGLKTVLSCCPGVTSLVGLLCSFFYSSHIWRHCPALLGCD